MHGAERCCSADSASHFRAAAGNNYPKIISLTQVQDPRLTFYIVVVVVVATYMARVWITIIFE